jgi:hypothetical protein
MPMHPVQQQNAQIYLEQQYVVGEDLLGIGAKDEMP